MTLDPTSTRKSPHTKGQAKHLYCCPVVDACIRSVAKRCRYRTPHVTQPQARGSAEELPKARVQQQPHCRSAGKIATGTRFWRAFVGVLSCRSKREHPCSRSGHTRDCTEQVLCRQEVPDQVVSIYRHVAVTPER